MMQAKTISKPLNALCSSASKANSINAEPVHGGLYGLFEKLVFQTVRFYRKLVKRSALGTCNRQLFCSRKEHNQFNMNRELERANQAMNKHF